MKKRLGIALVLALALILGLGTAVFADDPTEVNVDWDGSGWVGTTVTAGDDTTTTFSSGGIGISGQFEATDSNDNPYSYNVDSFTAGIQAEVQNGYIEFQTDRLDSKVSMYGAAGQQSYNFVGTDGWGAMATRSRTNYASAGDYTYGYPRTLNGHHFEVAGATSYEIVKTILASDGDWGQVWAAGSGSAGLDCMSSGMSATGVVLGAGGGCYTDADFTAIGTGDFRAQVEGNNYAEIYATGQSSWGSSASVAIVASWVNGGCNIGNYSMFAN